MREGEYIHVYFENMQWLNDQMSSNWYTGHCSMDFLRIRTNQLDVIHANAFKSPAFSRLGTLGIGIHGGRLRLNKGAFNGLDLIKTLIIEVKYMGYMPAALYHPFYVTLSIIRHVGWSNTINLNDMFADQIYRHLGLIEIYDVEMPQTVFRKLTEANFTAFRRLEALSLVNCGIESIDEHAFDYIGRTLLYINLDRNWIKFISVAMFRLAFESHSMVVLSFSNNKLVLPCTCAMIELNVMQCPIVLNSNSLCVDCVMPGPDAGFAISACRRDIDFSKFCINRNMGVMRVIGFRLGVIGDTVLLDTNFTSKFRLIFADLTNGTKCMQRASNQSAKCFIMDKSVIHLDLREIKELRQAEFISITAIPILVEFGARPMHLITVRHVLGAERGIRISEMELFLMAAWACALSSISGFVGIIYLARLKLHDRTSVTETM